MFNVDSFTWFVIYPHGMLIEIEVQGLYSSHKKKSYFCVHVSRGLYLIEKGYYLLLKCYYLQI